MKRFYAKEHRLKMLYILSFVGLLCIHYFFVTGTNDDAWFAEQLDKYNLIEYLYMRYELWTSRMFIEMAEVILSRINPWIWRSINALMILLLVYECNVIWGQSSRVLNTIIIGLLMLLTPIEMLNSAGWISTTVNYLWPITLGLFTMLPLYKYITGQKVYVYEYVFSIAACLFSSCQEQVAAVLLTVYLLYGMYCKVQHYKLPKLWWALIAITVISMAFILMCPGNENRSSLETVSWFPEFAGLSLGQKILTGYLTTFSYFISCNEYNTIFLLFSLVLLLAVFFTTGNVPARIVSVYPCVIVLIGGCVGRWFTNSGITTRIYWAGLLQNDKIAELSAYSKEHIFVECIVFFTVLCAILFSLYVIFGKTINWLCSLIILFAGICSKMIIGLSPTVYASGSRTATLAQISFVILIFICIQKCIEMKGVKRSLSYYIPFYVFALAVSIL